MAADVTAVLVTNTAGVSTGAMAFASWLQSNADNVTVPLAKPNLIFTKTASPVTPSSEVVVAIDDAALGGDATESASNASWDILAPGDTVEFTANDTMVQSDVDWWQ